MAEVPHARSGIPMTAVIVRAFQRPAGVIAALGLATMWLTGFGAVRADDAQYDIVIRNGRIVDGTGAPWYVADVAIRHGRIVKIGRIAAQDGKRNLDATGLIVAPGFVDMMGQTATPMLDDPATAINLLTQGITTINAGEGGSAAPLSQLEGERRGWSTMAEYFQLLEMKGLPVNVVQTVGHTQVRRLVLGDVDRRPSDDEMKEMRSLVREAMQAGAIGVSSALIYPPAVYATTRELAALSEVAGQYGGRYYTHMRNEGDQLLEAIDEALEIGRAGKVPVHIFHLKAAGKQNWGKMQLAIARIKAARASGHQVTADIYPYVNNGLGIAAFIHPRHFARGRSRLLAKLDDQQLRSEIRKELETTSGWENWFRHVGHDWNKVVIGQANDARYRPHAGKTVAEIAMAVGEDEWDTFFGLAKTGAFALPQSMTDANKIMALRQDFISFCTDVGPAGGSSSASHPRAFGSFPRLLSRYVRDLGATSLERAIAQASAAAANKVLVYDRGRIAEGQAADVIVFDYQALRDQADFANPHAVSQGMTHVLVNGAIVLTEGRFTGIRSGRVLRGPGYDPGKASHAVSQRPTTEGPAVFDKVIRQVMQEHCIPGVSVAITENGQLSYVRGFGYADVAEATPVVSDSLFRIASISKPITAVAIMQLVEQEKISLDDRVFELLKYEPDLPDGSKFDERQHEITIRHLLQHRGGWDRSQSFDAMFRATQFAAQRNVDAPAGPPTIIQVMLGKPLDFAPGERYAYSNYGYCLLGRVIEQLSGQSYEDYVKQHVLKPIGITSMRIGRTRLKDRAVNEVRYYDPQRGKSVFQADLEQTVPSAYGAWHLEAMDSHGAWIASASDIARFAAALDDPEDCPLLSAPSIAQMLDRPQGLAGHQVNGTPKASYYGLGWFVTVDADGNRSSGHSGSLPGTNTRLLSRPDGRNVVVLCNARSSPTANRVADIVLAEIQRAMGEPPDRRE